MTSGGTTPLSPTSYLGRRALAVHSALARCLHLAGDVAEYGVGAGATSLAFARLIAQRDARKTVHLFDTFQGLPDVFSAQDREGATGSEQRVGNYSHSPKEVRDVFEPGHRFALHIGPFSTTLPQFVQPLCFIHADADLYQSTVDIIEFADRVLVRGGVVVFDDYDNSDFPGVRRAVDAHLVPGNYQVSYSATQAFARKGV